MFHGNIIDRYIIITCEQLYPKYLYMKTLVQRRGHKRREKQAYGQSSRDPWEEDDLVLDGGLQLQASAEISNPSC